MDRHFSPMPLATLNPSTTTQYAQVTADQVEISCFWYQTWVDHDDCPWIPRKLELTYHQSSQHTIVELETSKSTSPRTMVGCSISRSSWFTCWSSTSRHTKYTHKRGRKCPAQSPSSTTVASAVFHSAFANRYVSHGFASLSDKQPRGLQFHFLALGNQCGNCFENFANYNQLVPGRFLSDPEITNQVQEAIMRVCDSYHELAERKYTALLCDGKCNVPTSNSNPSAFNVTSKMTTETKRVFVCWNCVEKG
jgi:hypothetical protein